MLRYIYLIIIGYLIYRLFKGLLNQDNKTEANLKADVIDEMIQDPVCKTYIPRRESFRRTFGGKEIFFCSRECADKFGLGSKNS